MTSPSSEDLRDTQWAIVDELIPEPRGAGMGADVLGGPGATF